MACQYGVLDDQSFCDDLNELKSDSLIRSLSRIEDELQDEKSKNLIQLNRGGVICLTKIGPIQFGLPPETVKDSLSLGIEVPTYYIIPSQRFDKKFGISVAEFEFPAYFNFFVKKRKIILICDQETANGINIVFQETLLGPVDYSNIDEDFYYTFPKDAQPDFQKELGYFAKNPSNPNEKLKIEMLISFLIFDKETNTIEIKQNDDVVNVVKGKGYFTIMENGVLLQTIKDKVKFPQEYLEYLNIHKPDETLKAEKKPPTLTEKDMKAMRSQQFDQEYESGPKIKSQQFEKLDKRRVSILLWNKLGQAKVTEASLSMQNIVDQEGLSFTPPDFGITVLGCSHGFDPKGSTSGYIFWIRGRGIMVDPPPFTSYHLKKMGIPTIIICAIIISHCHADHDAGAFHKILDDSRVEIITTRTIMNSFLRKYSAISGISIQQLKNLFIFRPAIIGMPLNIYGASFEFFYSLHSIPCIGFSVTLGSKSMFFSGDTYFEPNQLKEIKKLGIFSQKRYEQLSMIKFNQDIILHESGVPPIHTPQSVFQQLPPQVKNRLYLVHIAEKDLLKNSGLRIAKTGIENTMILIPPNADKTIVTLKRLDLLSKIPIFDHLTLTNIRWLMDVLQCETFNAGQIVVKEGTVGNKFYIIESGLAKVSSNQKGKEFERYYQLGDYFGETALIQQQGRRLATVVAITELKLLTLEKHDFWFIFGDGFGGTGPIIEKMTKLIEARKKKAIHILFKQHQTFLLNDRNSLFSELTPSQKTQMEMIMHEKELSKGAILWSVGDKAEFVIVLSKGSMVFINCPEEHLDEFESGVFIGEVKAMCDGTPLTTSVKARRKCHYFRIGKDDFLQFLSRNPGLFVLFSDFKYIE